MNRKSANPGDPVPHPSIADAVFGAVAEDGTVENRQFELDALENMEADLLDFAGCVFRRVQFAAVNARRVHFSNCRFEHCDLSGLPFKDGTLTRVEFIGCRGTGCAFERMKIKDVLFDQCQMNYLTLASCKLERVEFSGCDLSHAILFENVPKEWSLSNVRLCEAEIRGTSLKGVDLSDCEIDGIRVQPESLHGATVQLAQAPMLLGVFGVRVKL